MQLHLKKLFTLMLAAVMLLAMPSCGADSGATVSSVPSTQPTTTLSPYVTNPLTGIDDLSSAYYGKRPVAVMINNIKTAQAVQTAVGDADLVFETLVEGGITRLMAVYSDISKIGQIGTIRSSRYSFIELACGLDARYVYCGTDEQFALPLMQSLEMNDTLDLDNNASALGVRVQNGLDYEHTLYTDGEKILDAYNDGRTELKDRAKNPFSFNPVDAPVSYEQAAADFKVRFSGSYSTTFTYENDSGSYLRGNSNGTPFVDLHSGKYERFQNVLVLYTDVYSLADDYHMKSELTSGSGVYFTGGGYTQIKWSKGDSTAPLKLTDTQGNVLKLNAGNSYICITDTEYPVSIQ